MPDAELDRAPSSHHCIHPVTRNPKGPTKRHPCTCDVGRDHGYLVGPIARTFWGEDDET